MERSEMEKNLEQLKSSLASGELTGSELVRRLQIMIHNELSKPEKEVDIEFIETCSSLIRHIYPKIAERPEGYYEEQAAKFKIRLRQREKALRRKRILRPVIAVAAVLIIVFLSIGSIQFHWFTRESTPDQQQYVIQGHSVSIDMVEKAIAEHLEEGAFQTDDITILKEYLGFDLDYVNLLLPGWDISNSNTVTLQNYITTSIRYVNVEDSDKSFRYVITWFVNPEDAFYSIEQKKEGNVKKQNGIEVYYLDNAKTNSCCWIIDTSVHMLTTSTDTVELERITNMILRSST